MSRSQGSYRFIVASVIFVMSGVPAFAQWRSGNFPPPNAGVLVYRDIGGNPACASYDGQNCLWGKTQDEIDLHQVSGHWSAAGTIVPNTASRVTKIPSIGAIWRDRIK